MKQDRIVIPNAFTMEPKVHFTITRDDGTKEYRIMTMSEFNEWMENGGDIDDD